MDAVIARYGRPVRVALIAMLASVVSGASFHAGRAHTHGPPAVFGRMLQGRVRGYGGLPVLFARNVGEAPPQFAYIASGTGYGLALSRQGLTLALPAPVAYLSPSQPLGRAASGSVSLLHLRLAGAARHPVLRPERQRDSFSNYFIGNDPAHWRAHVPNFGAIRYEDVYAGIDWVIYGNRDHLLEYDFIVHPRADPARIVLAVAGAEHVSLDSNGELLIEVHGQTLRQLRPVVYQVSAAGIREGVEGRYTLSHGRVRIAIGHYDGRRTLYIDPPLAYSTYLGGTISDGGGPVAVDGKGDLFVAGYAGSPDFPTVDPYQAANPGAAFIAKFDPSGTRLLYSTYFGGTDGAGISGIAVDSAGSIYVAGSTIQRTFPPRTAFRASSREPANLPIKGSSPNSARTAVRSNIPPISAAAGRSMRLVG